MTVEAKTLDDAKGSLTGGDKTLDELADMLLSRMAGFMGECVQSDAFCAVAIDVKRDQSGKLLQMRFTPCDEVNGDPVRRYERDVTKSLALAH